MTDRQLLETIVKVGTEMRAAQKGFFNARDKKEKQGFLVQSKKSEKEFDTALFNIRQLIR